MASTTTYTRARAEFASLCAQVADTREPVIIRRRNAEDVALVSADELARPPGDGPPPQIPSKRQPPSHRHQPRPTWSTAAFFGGRPARKTRPWLRANTPNPTARGLESDKDVVGRGGYENSTISPRTNLRIPPRIHFGPALLGQDRPQGCLTRSQSGRGRYARPVLGDREARATQVPVVRDLVATTHGRTSRRLPGKRKPSGLPAGTISLLTRPGVQMGRARRRWLGRPGFVIL